MTDRSDEHDEHPDDRGAARNTGLMADHPVGPDDAGNAVVHGMSLLVSG